MLAFGADPTTPAPTPAPTPVSASDAAFINVEPDGTRIFKDPVAVQILQMLTSMSVIYVDASNAKLDVRAVNDPRPNAAQWAADALSQNRSVLYGSPSGITAAMTPTTGIDRYLKSETSHAGEIADAGPTALPYYAVLARPGTASAGMGPVGLAFVALGVGALGYYLFSAFAKK
jgi:hypothetical protein